MEVQNALANRIDTAGEMISYDEACKQVLANKTILAWIMKGCLKEYNGLLKMLDVLLSEETLPGEKKRTLREEFGIPMTTKLEGDVDAMCNLSKGVYDRAVDKTLVETIRNLLDTTDWDIEVCMDKMKIPSEKRQVYRDAVLGKVLSV